MAFAKRTEFESLPFFRVKENLSVFAAIIEPESARETKGKWGPTTFVDARITLFQTAEQLQNGEPAVTARYTIGGGALATDMADFVDEMRFVNFRSVPTDKGNPALVANDINDPALIEAAEKYIDKRAAEDAGALDDLLGV